ncbi:T9SS type A sorting domain-containing protein [bacterium SCSIO 12643]|nr:T9SS type A sorting domain-containing protein [bacterium SCSIO 12643]
MIKKLHAILILLSLVVISPSVIAVTYTTTGNNSWSPSNPGNSINSSDDFIINHTVTLNGLRLLSGGSITINSGGFLKMGWSARFDLGSSVHVKSGGKLQVSQLTVVNYSDNFVIDGDIVTKNGTFANYQSGVITYNQGASWTFNQMSFVNYGTLILNEDADWKNGSVAFSLGTVTINGKLSIKNLSLANNAKIEGVGQVEVKNGNGIFVSNGEINGCYGNACIPPSTIGNTTYLAYHSTTSGNTFTTYDGGNVPATTCTTTLQVLDDLNFSSDKTIGDLVVSPGVNITVDPGVSLTVCSGILSEGRITVENTGSLVQTSSADNNEGSGVYIIKRNGGNDPLSFNSWSSPIKSATIADVYLGANPCDIFCFESSTQSWKFDYPVNYQTTCNGNQVTFGAANVISGGDGVMDPARGYFVPGDNSITRTFSGTVNNGDVTIAVDETNLGNNPNWSMDDWNLVGNPYPSAIDLEKFYSDNSGVITGDYYFWVDDNSNGATYNQSNDYAVYNQFSSISANGSALPSQFAAAGQGFWVYALQDGNVTFTNAMRVTGNNSGFFKTEANKDKVVVRVGLENDSNNFNQTAVGYSLSSSNAYDMAQDAPKGESNSALLFGSMIDTNVYSIQAFEKLEDLATYSVPLYVKTDNEGNHTFSINSSENMGSHILVFLKDNATGTVTDLKAQNYTIYLPVGEYNSRFELMMENTGAPTGVEDVVNSSKVDIYQNQNTIRVQSKDLNVMMESVTVFNLIGKRIAGNTNFNNSMVDIDASTLNSGAYLVRVEFSNGEVETRKVVFVKN